MYYAENNKKLTLRDGVEVFLYEADSGFCDVLFLFLSNRRRLKIRCEERFITILEHLAVDSLKEHLVDSAQKKDVSVQKFLNFLLKEGILVEDGFLFSSSLPNEYVERYKRQIFFLLDLTKNTSLALEVQKKIYNSHITIFGLGAVGSTILVELCMLGFRNFTLVDYNTIEESDISRTLYPIELSKGKLKIDAAQLLLEDFAYAPNIQKHNSFIKTNTELDGILKGTNFIINTADEPYIGYTNIKLSRFALQKNIPLFVAGGFDAHLASSGELLIPFETPCADCYASFFHENLKDWKPIPHPVQERKKGFGGLGTLSTFSASSAALAILGHFLDLEQKTKLPSGRGEFLFHDYTLDTFTVEKDSTCQFCGRNNVNSI